MSLSEFEQENPNKEGGKKDPPIDREELIGNNATRPKESEDTTLLEKKGRDDGDLLG